MSRYNSPQFFDAARKNTRKAFALALAAVAFAGCAQNELTVSADGGCVQKSALIEPSETVQVTSPRGTTVALGNYFGEVDSNFSAAVIETDRGEVLKEVAVEDYETVVSNLPTDERLTLSTLQTDTTAVDGFVKICPTTQTK